MTNQNKDCYICMNVQHYHEDASGHKYHIAFGGYGIECPSTEEEYKKWSAAIRDPRSRWDFD